MKFKNYLLLEMSLKKAKEFATKKHTGQFRKSTGEPYIIHPKGVFNILKQLKVHDVVILVAAFLHDTLEDTKTTYNEIKNTFNKEVADLVFQLTSNQKDLIKLGKPKYLVDKMIKISNNALIIKLADRLHNLQDIKTVNKNFGEKMYDQTTYIIKELRKKRNLNNIQKKLIRAIDKKLLSFEKENITL